MQSKSFRANKSFQIWCGLLILLLGIAIRLPHMNQSLWYDEMTTLVEYVIQPWSKIVAAKAGEYVPNNHVLHTVLVKIVYTMVARGELIPPREAVLRLPAFLAALLVPFALAWPLRRSDPVLALIVALVTMLHPWLVAMSVEARGYSLLLSLGIIATNCLGTRPIAYVISLALAIYTVPLAVLLIPAHAAVMLVLRRSMFAKWLIHASIAIALATILYLPMYRGLIGYYRHPYPPTMDYRQFLDWLPRYAMAGVRLPQNADPLAPPITGTIFWALPTLAIIFGSIVGWSRVSLRPILLTMGTATICGMILPLLDSGATEVRFVPWIMPWFCVAIVAGFLSPAVRWGKIAGALGLSTLIGWQVMQDVTMPPNQPIREGIQLADRIVPPGRDILIVYIGARESIALYGETRHPLLAGPDVKWTVAMQQKALVETGHLPWVLIYFEQLARDRDIEPPESRGMWTNLMIHYHLAAPRLPARLTPIAIYAPNEARKP
jgi:hypothetical protein